MELCRELRARSSTLPIIFLTNHDSEFDIISGLAVVTLTLGVHLAALLGWVFQLVPA